MRLVTAALTASLLLLPACSSDDGKPKGASPEKVMAAAAAKLDATSGVDLELSSAGLPDQGAGFLLVGGEGTAVHPDSFEGTLNVKAMGLLANAQVIAKGGTVWIKQALLGPGFKQVNPADYGVPDPGKLLSADGGVSDLLAETKDLEAGDTVRGGADNKEVLTEYTGVLTAAQIHDVLGMGTGDFKVRYEVDAKGYLRTVEVTGGFYAGEPAATYTVHLVRYGVTKDISAP
jgi:lipoprotein LprG